MDGCPSWLEKLGSEQLGDAWPAERAALAWMPKRYLRVNTLKCTRDELQAILAKEHVTTIPVDGVETALQVTSDAALFPHQGLRRRLLRAAGRRLPAGRRRPGRGARACASSMPAPVPAARPCTWPP